MSLTQTNVQALASALFSLDNVESRMASMGAEHVAKVRDIHESRIAAIMEFMPSGSGFDNGTKLADESTPQRLVFETSFHHMDEHGGYAGWTDHKVIVTPSFVFGFEMRVTGRDRNLIKDYIAGVFQHILSEESAPLAV